MNMVRKIVWMLVIPLFALVGCTKDRNDPQPLQKTASASHPHSLTFTYKTQPVFFRMADMVKRLSFTSGIPASSFTPSSHHLVYTGNTTSGGGSPSPSSSCRVSGFGFPGEIEWSFHYTSTNDLDYILVISADHSEDISMIFAYNSSGLISRITYWDNPTSDWPILSFYDEFTYSPDGSLASIYEYEPGSTPEERNFIVTAKYSNGKPKVMETDYYDGKYEYFYNNQKNLYKMEVSVTFGSDVYTDVYEYEYDNQNNFWLPMNIFALLGNFAETNSVNNITKETYTQFNGHQDIYEYSHTYNAEGYPSESTYYGSVDYLNCGK
ncbi:MAG: hypothetical protein NTU44_14240 [Bacteroidetes bacterium]|nr:hypothetical protein [Bacteroidota bacterium]